MSEQTYACCLNRGRFHDQQERRVEAKDRVLQDRVAKGIAAGIVAIWGARKDTCQACLHGHITHAFEEMKNRKAPYRMARRLSQC